MEIQFCLLDLIKIYQNMYVYCIYIYTQSIYIYTDQDPEMIFVSLCACLHSEEWATSALCCMLNGTISFE